MIPDYRLATFMRESNAIEGEVEHPHASDHICWHGTINPGDLVGIRLFMDLKKIRKADLLNIHKQMFDHRLEGAGAYRLYNVSVGGYFPPDWKDVSKLMDAFFKAWPKMDSWTAHNQFEAIHPFGDGNGRMGRLLWLHKAVQERYNFGLPFLHQYYYQTLSHVNEQFNSRKPLHH